MQINWLRTAHRLWATEPASDQNGSQTRKRQPDVRPTQRPKRPTSRPMRPRSRRTSLATQRARPCSRRVCILLWDKPASDVYQPGSLCDLMRLKEMLMVELLEELHIVWSSCILFQMFINVALFGSLTLNCSPFLMLSLVQPILMCSRT